MGWKEDVTNRFSENQAAQKWHEMYAYDTGNLDDYNFRLRRDHTVNYLVESFATDASLLDLGCGAGPVVYEMLQRGYNIVGIDYSMDMLNNAKRRLATDQRNEMPLINGNGKELPFADESFDCVTCLGVISYVENYEDVIDEIYRVLKPNGTVIIAFRNKYNPLLNDPAKLIYYILKKITPFKKNDMFRIGQPMNASSVTSVVQNKGFTYVDFKGIGFGPYSIFRKKLYTEKISIKLSNFMTSLASWVKAEFLFKLGTDVNILTFRKTENSFSE